MYFSNLQFIVLLYKQYLQLSLKKRKRCIFLGTACHVACNTPHVRLEIIYVLLRNLTYMNLEDCVISNSQLACRYVKALEVPLYNIFHYN